MMNKLLTRFYIQSEDLVIKNIEMTRKSSNLSRIPIHQKEAFTYTISINTRGHVLLIYKVLTFLLQPIAADHH